MKVEWKVAMTVGMTEIVKAVERVALTDLMSVCGKADVKDLTMVVEKVGLLVVLMVYTWAAMMAALIQAVC